MIFQQLTRAPLRDFGFRIADCGFPNPQSAIRNPKSAIPTCALMVILVSGAGSYAQSRPSRPALIRDTATAEGKEEADAKEKEKVFSPLEAEKNLRVGDFYFKKKNYSAAIQRYVQALQHQPSLVRAYESLGKAYEKNGERAKALNVYKDFLQKFPDSPKAPDFRSRISELEKKSG